jgi:hypothetical protein
MNEYNIRTQDFDKDNGLVKVKGYDAGSYNGFHLFVYKPFQWLASDGTLHWTSWDNGWTVTEFATGARIAGGKTRIDAIEHAKQIMDSVDDKQKLDNLLDHIVKFGFANKATVA